MKTEKTSWQLAAETQRGKKEYLKRLVETKEANNAIREFHDKGATSSSEMCEAQDLEAEGGMRDVSS